MNYVASKVAKRMDTYKVRSNPKDMKRKILLSLSFGVSSVTLLHILDRQLQIQLERTSRTGYEVHVLFVDESVAYGQAASTEVFALLKERYPSYPYTVVSLARVFEFCDVSDDPEITSIGLDLESSNFPSSKGDGSERLERLLSSLPSSTSRADIIGILKSRLVVEFAKRNTCSSIVWGDSTTRLAEKTLSETAKGRGFSLPWQIADGLSPHGITFIFPMRDLLRKEIIIYSGLTTPPLTPLVTERPPSASVSASSKDTTIDDLMSQYFASVEQNYPSIVSNVVRTASRLQAPPSSRDTLTSCQICRLPVNHGADGLFGWGGDQDQMLDSLRPRATNTLPENVLCYGCARSTLGVENFRAGLRQ